MKLNIGDNAPNFKGVDQNGNSVALSNFKGKNLIMYFYPKDNTPGCTAEACDLRDNYEMWIERGYAVVGVSPDSEQSHQKFIDKYDLPFPLIADTDKTITKDFGAWGLKKLYGREYEGLLRTTFVIDATGIITNIFTKVKTNDHTNQILESLK
ncbi:MAG: thioredoxin-dependent thiol peroxidase [Bacteroidales bacterium]|jgi:peroxiredoxin Q/BCP|nr:thioredoxin-dependent thiol peroxidase [Bacteroidales bacterium]MDG2081575.1 thioredoxin-dependent thiol peroxidase [Bacteroidales bacterium]|tara:strand:- start:1124 stop:1582 length:459 start_codon:yes stop_codon:yes gene_type:complete